MTKSSGDCIAKLEPQEMAQLAFAYWESKRLLQRRLFGSLALIAGLWFLTLALPFWFSYLPAILFSLAIWYWPWQIWQTERRLALDLSQAEKIILQGQALGSQALGSGRFRLDLDNGQSIQLNALQMELVEQNLSATWEIHCSPKAQLIFVFKCQHNRNKLP
jgi:hypothetical protein